MSEEFQKKIGRSEIIFSSTLKYPKRSAVQQVLSSKTYEHFQSTSNRKLRHKLDAIPDAVKEQIRVNYVKSKDIELRNYQKRQCKLLTEFEKFLKEHTMKQSKDYREHSIGGREDGLYEKMYKIEPATKMSKAQFLTVMRKVFKFNLEPKVEIHLGELFDAFDVDHEDYIDWRAFLCFLSIMIQPGLGIMEYLNQSYAIYASSGYLDMECRSKITLGCIKDFIQVPVLLSSRQAIRNMIDDAWFELVSNCYEATQIHYAKNAPTDHDQNLLTYSLFTQLATTTSFRRLLDVSKTFGGKDSRPQVYVIEEIYYHPDVLLAISKLRRVIRNDNEADLFVKRSHLRCKAKYLLYWKFYLARREKARNIICDMKVHWVMLRCGYSFDRWKQKVMETIHGETIQRVARGHIGRQRRRLLTILNKNAMKLQRNIRKLRYKLKYESIQKKRYIAAMNIQRVYRGLVCRRLVYNRVLGFIDTRRRKLLKERVFFHFERKKRASEKIASFAKLFVRKLQAYRKIKVRNQIESVEYDRQIHQHQVEKTNALYRIELEAWYKQRKEKYDIDRFHENQTYLQRSKIIAYRRRNDFYRKEQLEIQRQAKQDRMEQSEIESWLTMWELRKNERQKQWIQHCKHCLILPETPDEKQLKKELLEKTKAQLKIVLKRSDRMRIPMEIPEGMEIAQEEVLENEGKLERDRVAEEMRQGAMQAEAAKEEKRLLEEANEKRRKSRISGYSATKIQTQWRMYIARKQLRKECYLSFIKHFDTSSGNYYYENTVTKKISWNKPQYLGSYDIDAKNQWICLKDNNNDTYYYNPFTWAMQWKKPEKTIFCSQCDPQQFCVARLDYDKKFYCEDHFTEAVNMLINEEHIHPKFIWFKVLEGCIEGSARSDLSVLEDVNWHNYCLKHQLKEYGLEDDEKEEDEEEAKIEEDIMCSRCNADLANGFCVQCLVHFCNSCFGKKHKSAMWSNHEFRIIDVVTNHQPDPDE